MSCLVVLFLLYFSLSLSLLLSHSLSNPLLLSLSYPASAFCLSLHLDLIRLGSEAVLVLLADGYPHSSVIHTPTPGSPVDHCSSEVISLSFWMLIICQRGHYFCHHHHHLSCIYNEGIILRTRFFGIFHFYC